MHVRGEKMEIVDLLKVLRYGLKGTYMCVLPI
jgi:hypothetical protein